MASFCSQPDVPMGAAGGVRAHKVVWHIDGSEKPLPTVSQAFPSPNRARHSLPAEPHILVFVSYSVHSQALPSSSAFLGMAVRPRSYGHSTFTQPHETVHEGALEILFALNEIRIQTL